MPDVQKPVGRPRSRTGDWVESLYERLAEDDEGRVCRGISDEACRETPGNFFRILAANSLTTIGDKVGSAKTTLPWLLGAAGAPAWTVSLLVPIRESGSMLPQMAVGAWVRRRPIRKVIWAAGSTFQGLALLGIAWTAVILEGLSAGLAVLALLILFSLARGASSVAYKDVLGKTIPKTRRGRLSGWISAISGLGAMGVGGGVGLFSGEASPAFLAGLLSAAAILWFFAAWFFIRVVEFEGETDGGKQGLVAALNRWRLLRDDRPFRRFVVGRALAMGSGLAAPFYILLARDDLGAAARFLGLFLLMEGLAGVVSAPIWGRWADRSSRSVFALASGAAGAISLTVAAMAWSGISGAVALWFYPTAFFLLGVAHAGVRLGRKTYLVDMAEGNARTDYVAVSNSAIGLLLLAAGMIGALASLFSVEATLCLLGAAGLLGAFLALQWKEVSGGA